MSQATIRLALDWTPNTNHTGFFVSKAKGWYDEAGISLEIMPPSLDYGLNETPTRRVVQGLADACLAPSESVISCWTSEPEKLRPVAVAAVLTTDASAIACRKEAGVSCLADLDGKRYASYGGRFEMNIIRQLVKAQGGLGSVDEVLPDNKLTCFDLLMHGEVDATWVFLPWEGVEAEMRGQDLTYFPLHNSGVVYGYSPVLLVSPAWIKEKPEVLRDFLAVTGRGYRFAQQQPQESAQLLRAEALHPALASVSEEMLVKSQEFLSKGQYYVEGEAVWGKMEGERWKSFIDWLLDNQLLSYRDGQLVSRGDIDFKQLYTNDFL